eukprot:5223266-Amphidinium_carterae.1
MVAKACLMSSLQPSSDSLLDPLAAQVAEASNGDASKAAANAVTTGQLLSKALTSGAMDDVTKRYLEGISTGVAREAGKLAMLPPEVALCLLTSASSSPLSNFLS